MAHILKHITIWADRDESHGVEGGMPWVVDVGAGEKFAQGMADNLGYAVSITLPGQRRSTCDWLDIFAEGGSDAVRAGLENAYDYEPQKKRNGSEPQKGIKEKDTETDSDGHLNEDFFAQEFAGRNTGIFKYDHHTGKWYRWTETRWEKNETKFVFNQIREMCREFVIFAPKKVKGIITKASTSSAVERFCQADPIFAVTSELWDRDHFLLGTPGGTVDLRTGEIRPADPNDYITKSTSVIPADNDDAPIWKRFLFETTRGKKDLIRFLQQMCGYCLTGNTSEHVLFFVYGGGGNGKSVFIIVISNILGDYAVTAPMETFVASKNDRHPTDLAMLKGSRLVAVSETEEGRAWDQTRIKQLTGGDPVTARFMRQDFFTYFPTFKLVVVGNYQPRLRDVGEAEKRRFNIIPFINKPANPDRHLVDKLSKEYPQILRWMIDGCIDWQQNGFVRPDVVLKATDEYFGEQDLFGQWIDDCCEFGNHFYGSAGELYSSWSKYAERSGERPGSIKTFSQKLTKRGYEKGRSMGMRFYSGIRLKTDNNLGDHPPDNWVDAF
jgi:putative DNA primase/helicase